MKNRLLLSLAIYQIVEWLVFLLISSIFPNYFWNVFLGLIGIDLIATVIIYPNRVHSFIKLLKEKN